MGPGIFTVLSTTTARSPRSMQRAPWTPTSWASTFDAQMMMHGIICIVTLTCQQVDDPNGIGTTTFNGVNDRGQIVGFEVNGGDNTIGLLANPVSEPTSLALLAAGFFALGFINRRRLG